MKKYKILFWTATILVVLWEGVMPLATVLFTPQYVTLGTKPLGYPDYFAYSLLYAKVLGVIAIAVPFLSEKVKEWAYAGLFFNLFFATLSHIIVDQNIGYILLPVIVGVLLTVSYIYHNKLHYFKQHSSSVKHKLNFTNHENEQSFATQGY